MQMKAEERGISRPAEIDFGKLDAEPIGFVNDHGAPKFRHRRDYLPPSRAYPSQDQGCDLEPGWLSF